MLSDRLELVALLSARFGAEVAERSPEAVIPWPTMPTVAALLEHVGTVQRWVTEVLRTGRPAGAQPGPAAGDNALAWYGKGRAALLAALAEPADRPCWTIGNREGTAEFWRRRMVFEHAKHLIDVRAADGAGWTVAPELTPDDCADGIDELFEVFLRRSRPSLPVLPATVALQATDLDRRWRIGPDWSVDSEGPAAATIRAPAADLALALWERADLAGDAALVEGDTAAAVAVRAAAIHPW